MIRCWIPGRQDHFQANPEYSIMAIYGQLMVFGHLPRKRVRFSPWFSSIAEVVSSCIQLSGCRPGCRRSCLLAAQRCRTRRPPKQVVSRRLDRWYRPIGLRAQVPSPTWNYVQTNEKLDITGSCHVHFPTTNLVAIVFHYLRATWQWKIPTWFSGKLGVVFSEFPENPLYQKPPTTSHVIAKRCASVSLTFGYSSISDYRSPVYHYSHYHSCNCYNCLHPFFRFLLTIIIATIINAQSYAVLWSIRVYY